MKANHCHSNNPASSCESIVSEGSRLTYRILIAAKIPSPRECYAILQRGCSALAVLGMTQE